MVSNMALLLAWTIADPLLWERVDTGRTEAGVLLSYGRCASLKNVSSILIGLVAAVNIVALLFANVLAYLTRLLEVAFNESKFVGLAMASILQATLIGLPLLFLADANPVARYVVRSVLVFVICMSVLVFIFVPKVTKADEPMMIRFSVSGVSKRRSFDDYNGSDFINRSGDLGRNSRGSASGGKMESIPEGDSGGGSSDPDFKISSRSPSNSKLEASTEETSTLSLKSK